MNIVKGIFLVIFLIIMPLYSYAATQDEVEDKIISLSQNSRYEEALDLIDEYIRQYPDAAFGYGEKGSALSSLYRLDEAVEYYKKALDTPDAVRTIWLGNIARVYRKMNKYDEAIGYLKKAIEEDKRMFSDNMFSIADLYILQGDRVKASFSYDDAKEKIEESEKALIEMSETNKGNVYGRAAWVAYQIDREKEALEYAEKYKKLKDTDMAGLGFAIYLARYGYVEKAKQEFASVNKENCDALSIALFFVLINDDENAARYFSKSYYEQQSPAQLRSWREDFKQDAMCQHDDWKKARAKEWFKSKVGG